MEVYQNYKVQHDCPSDYIVQLLDIRLHQVDGWVHRTDMEDNYHKNKMQFDGEILCVETPTLLYDEHRIKGIIWIWRYSDYFEIFNITPLIGNHLTHAEYNYIISAFDGSIVKKLTEDYELRVEISKPYFDMEDHIGKEALEALRFFSQTSNRSTGHTHPMDFKKWAHFIFILFRQHRELSADDLMNWLIEDGWTDDMANELSLDFEYTIEILQEYENY